MPTLFVIAHAPLASALKEVAAHVFPDAAADLITLDVQPDQSAEDVDRAICERLERHGDQPTLVLTDVFGATPCNVARRVCGRTNVRVLAGVNVPMLWRALTYRDEPLDTLCALAAAGGAQGVVQIAAPPPGPDPDPRTP